MPRAPCECCSHGLHVISTVSVHCMSLTFNQRSLICRWRFARFSLHPNEARLLLTYFDHFAAFQAALQPSLFYLRHSLPSSIKHTQTHRTAKRRHQQHKSPVPVAFDLNTSPDSHTKPHKPQCPKSSKALTASRSQSQSSLRRTWSVSLAPFSPRRMSTRYGASCC